MDFNSCDRGKLISWKSHFKLDFFSWRCFFICGRILLQVLKAHVWAQEFHHGKEIVTISKQNISHLFEEDED